MTFVAAQALSCMAQAYMRMAKSTQAPNNPTEVNTKPTGAERISYLRPSASHDALYSTGYIYSIYIVTAMDAAPCHQKRSSVWVLMRFRNSTLRTLHNENRLTDDFLAQEVGSVGYQLSLGRFAPMGCSLRPRSD